MRDWSTLQSLVWIDPGETVTYSILDVAEALPEFGVGYCVEHVSRRLLWDWAISALRRIPLGPGRSMGVHP